MLISPHRSHDLTVKTNLRRFRSLCGCSGYSFVVQVGSAGDQADVRHSTRNCGVPDGSSWGGGGVAGVVQVLHGVFRLCSDGSVSSPAAPEPPEPQTEVEDP
jgi:hypothetical protein